MTGYCTVELQALAQLVTQLGECADDMRGAMKQLKDIGPGNSGYAELEAACDEFQDKWGHGIGRIADAASGVTDGLLETRKVYQELEDRVRASVTAPGKAGGA